MKSLGLILLLTGIVWALVAARMETTVTSEPETIGSGAYSVYVPPVTVQNIGLMDARRNHLMFAGLTLLAGIILIGFGSARGTASEPNLRPCPICADPIQPAALKCRYCNADLPDTFRTAVPAKSAPISPVKSFLIMLVFLAVSFAAFIVVALLASK